MQSTYRPLPPTFPFPTFKALPTRVERNVTDFAILFTVVLMLAIAILVSGWQLWHQMRIYTGVSVAGVPIGGLTRAEAIDKLGRNLPPSTLPVLYLTLQGRRWSIQPQQLWRPVDWTSTVNRAYLLGRRDDFATQLIEQLMTALGKDELTPELMLNDEQLRAGIRQIAVDIRRPPLPATRIGAIAIPGQIGIEVDVEATVQNVQAVLQNYHRGQALEASIVVTSLAPTITETDHGIKSASWVKSDEIFAPFRLQNTQFHLNFVIDPVAWRTIVLSENPPRLNEPMLRSLLGAWAQQIDRPARDARLRLDAQTGNISVWQASLPGRHLEIDATVAAIQATLMAGRTVSDLIIAVVPPAVDSERVNEMGIRELVASETTYFQGSSAERIHNIEAAAVQFEGLVIPPGGIFSFNDMVGDVSAANGFGDSLIIWGDQTVVGIGGGVCQVSTTIFRAAYKAGFPIVERYNHGYIVEWYGEPGLDATIFTPTVDFRFRNDSDSYLLIEPVVDASQGLMTFNFYGTKTNRQVTLSKPVQTDIRQPEAPEYRVDESLAPGQIQQVEWEKPGMQVSVTRTIVANGVTHTDTTISHYQPWRAVYLVGPGTEVPQTATAAGAHN